jgi:uncharacterized membrane protein
MRGHIGWIFAALLGASLATLQLLEQKSLGFPDGHLTELEQALRWPHVGLAGLCLVVAVGLLWPGGRGRWYLLAILALLLVTDWVGLPMIGQAMGLDSGQGG